MGTPKSALMVAGAEPPDALPLPPLPHTHLLLSLPLPLQQLLQSTYTPLWPARGIKPELPTLPECWEPAGQAFHKPSPSCACFNIISYFSSAAGSRGVMDGTTDMEQRTRAMWLDSSLPARNEPVRRAILPEIPA